MDIYNVKLKLMDLISKADGSLNPRTTHVLGNMYIPSYMLSADKYPIVTVQINANSAYGYGSTTPSLAFGEYYIYDFVAYVFATELSESRRLGDNILDYLKLHNRHSDVKIIDITDFSIAEAPTKHGARALWRVEIKGKLTTEESLS